MGGDCRGYGVKVPNVRVRECVCHYGLSRHTVVVYQVVGKHVIMLY